MNRGVSLILGVGCLIMAAGLSAQVNQGQEETITFKAQVRARGEIDQRDLNSKTGYDSYTFLRTRFGALLQPVKHYSAFIQFQDSRVFGKEKSPTDDSKNVDLHQAYIEAKHFIWDKMDVRLGRMEVSYGEERLIGRSNWGNTGRSLDGSLFMFNLSGPLKLDVFAYRLNENSPPPTLADTTAVPDKEDRDFMGLYLTYNHSDYFNADAYIIGDGDHTRNAATHGKDSLQRATIGTFLSGRFGSFSYKTEMAYQTGTISGASLSAFLLTGSFGYASADAAWKPSVVVGCDYVSGDNNLADKKIRTFNTLFGSSRYYGGMDYFIDIARHTAQLGLQDNMIKIKIQPADAVTAGLDYHYFLSAQKDKTLNSKVFGHEADLVVAYKANTFVSFESGFSIMRPGKLLKKRFGGRGDPGMWSYLTMQFDY